MAPYQQGVLSTPPLVSSPLVAAYAHERGKVAMVSPAESEKSIVRYCDRYCTYIGAAFQDTSFVKVELSVYFSI